MARVMHNDGVKDSDVLLKALTLAFTADFQRWAAAASLSAVMFLLPDDGVRMSLSIALGLAFVDLITGVAAALLSGEALRSAGIKRTIIKVTGYVVSVSVVSVAIRQVTGSQEAARFLATLLANTVLLAEAVSILENLDKMGVPLPKFVIRILRQQLKKLSDEGKEQAKADA